MELRIVPVTAENRISAENLQVYPNQVGYIEPVVDCLKEADNLSDWRPMCIYDDELLVGFTMYGRIKEKKYTRLWFDRLLIDKRYQGRGYAKSAIRLILRRIIKEYPDESIYLSVYEENINEISLYKYYGFEFTGEIDKKGEKIMLYKGNLNLY